MGKVTEQQFFESVDQAEPPAGLAPQLLAIRHGLRGEWDAAHRIVQALDDADAAWVHAWLHRVEGDESNAGYWYRRAGRPVGTGSTDSEGRAIAAALLG